MIWSYSTYHQISNVIDAKFIVRVNNLWRFFQIIEFNRMFIKQMFVSKSFFLVLSNIWIVSFDWSSKVVFSAWSTARFILYTTCLTRNIFSIFRMTVRVPSDLSWPNPKKLLTSLTGYGSDREGPFIIISKYLNLLFNILEGFKTSFVKKASINFGQNFQIYNITMIVNSK